MKKVWFADRDMFHASLWASIDDYTKYAKPYYPAAEVERLVEAAKEAENALLDYIPTLEKHGASLFYGHSVLRKLKAALAPFVEPK